MPLKLLNDFVVCVIAVVLYSLLMSSPKKSILPSALVAAAGYIIYDIIYLRHQDEGHELLAYFMGTLFIAIFGEILARTMKMPSTIFVFPAIVPLVPGIGLYRTMLMLVQNEYDSAIRMGVQTLLLAGSMAVAIALVNIIARYFMPKRH